jgi:UDP-N-acetylmuramyl pentapeptide phosphotransferase/UDP-N-acetylglucosamine-1-phosphate transferase
MDKFNPNYFGIIFTVIFIGFILVVTVLLNNNSLDDNKISILIITAAVFIAMGISSYRKKIPRTVKYVLTTRKYVPIFVFGISVGFGSQWGLNTAYDLNYIENDLHLLVYGILLVTLGYSGLLFFTIMAILVSVMRIPYVKDRIEKKYGETLVTPFIEGAALGLGIHAILEFVTNGIPLLFR